VHIQRKKSGRYLMSREHPSTRRMLEMRSALAVLWPPCLMNAFWESLMINCQKSKRSLCTLQLAIKHAPTAWACGRLTIAYLRAATAKAYFESDDDRRQALIYWPLGQSESRGQAQANHRRTTCGYSCHK
jgi:hypothetical protein